MGANQMKIEIITHFPKDDPTCCGDYYSVDVKIDGELARHYNDEYDDRGDEKSEAFVDGYLYANYICESDNRAPLVIRTDKADGKV
jgi:hypothetical protein